MSDIPEQEENTPQPKKTRALSPNGKKRGPKPKPVNKKIRVRVREDLIEDDEPVETGNSLSYEPPRRAISEDEKCEYVELTIMEQTDEPRECFFNNGVNDQTRNLKLQVKTEIFLLQSVAEKDKDHRV